MGTRLYVSNIATSAAEENVRDLFAEKGQVESVNLIMTHSGKPKGFAFVAMASEEDAAKAIETLNGSLFLGRPLAVSEANTQEPRERRDLDRVSNSKRKK